MIAANAACKPRGKPSSASTFFINATSESISALEGERRSTVSYLRLISVKFASSIGVPFFRSSTIRLRELRASFKEWAMASSVICSAINELN